MEPLSHCHRKSDNIFSLEGNSPSVRYGIILRFRSYSSHARWTSASLLHPLDALRLCPPSNVKPSALLPPLSVWTSFLCLRPYMPQGTLSLPSGKFTLVPPFGCKLFFSYALALWRGIFPLPSGSLLKNLQNYIMLQLLFSFL